MTAAFIWLVKLILSHLITDFILQPKNWVDERTAKHFASPKLYLHCLISAAFAFIILVFQYWLVIIIILLHIYSLMDGNHIKYKPQHISLLTSYCTCW